MLMSDRLPPPADAESWPEHAPAMSAILARAAMAPAVRRNLLDLRSTVHLCFRCSGLSSVTI
jgi:hypothetical protein